MFKNNIVKLFIIKYNINVIIANIKLNNPKPLLKS